MLQDAKVVDSRASEAIELASLAGLYLDPWQCLVLEYICALRDDQFWDEVNHCDEYRWAALEFGLVVARQNGKGPHELSTPVRTFNRGWTTFADISKGDEVFGSDGRPTKVTGTSEVYTDEDCYRVTFTDGSSYVVGGGHLWSVRHKSGKFYEVLETEYLSTRVGGCRSDNGRMEYNYRVRCDAQIDYDAVDLPIDPYLLGYWLGDGKSSAASITVGHEDLRWLTGKLNSMGVSTSEPNPKDHSKALDFRFWTERKWGHDGFHREARDLGVLNDKHIPEVYLSASIEQRKRLLAGLLDSDGSARMNTRSTQVEFSTSMPALAEGFRELVRSLGIRVTEKVGKTSLNGVRKKDRHRFLWTPTWNPFHMPRKSGLFVEPMSNRQSEMSIVSIERTLTVPTRCIEVDNADGIYLVGKSFTPTHNSILEARELAGLFLFGEKTIIHSAHLFDTSQKHFERICSLIEYTPDLAKEVRNISRSHGKEGVFLRNGQELLFKARSKGGGRGFSCDLLVFDEAMLNLDTTVIEAALPTISARPNGQVLYMGSAGTQESEHFGRVRNRAMNVLKGKSTERIFGFMEWSAELCNDDCLPDCEDHDAPDDPETWAKSNPAMGFRISAETIRDAEYRSMSPDGFAKERLSVGDWPVEGGGWRVIAQDRWERAADEGSELVGKFCLAVDSSPGASWSCISAVGQNSDEMVHAEITGLEGAAIDFRPGIKWVVPRIMEIWKAAKPAFVVIDPSSPAGTLKEELESLGVKVETLTSREFAQACGDIKSAVAPRSGDGTPTLAHLNQTPLNTAVAGAEKKPVVDLWIWSRADSVADVTPLRCITLGYWGFKQHIFRKKSKPWAMYV